MDDWAIKDASGPAAARETAAGRAEEVLAFFDRPERYLTGNRTLAIRTRLVAELAGEVRGDRIIDLGCGDGRLSRQFLGRAAELTLVDTSPRMLELARDGIPVEHSGRVRYVPLDILDVPDEQYGLVICVGVLAHVASVDRSLTRIVDLIKPGGRCILQLTDRDHPVGRLLHQFHSSRLARGGSGYSLNRLSLASITEMALAHGLRTGATRRYCFIPSRSTRVPAEFLNTLDRLSDHPRLRRLGSEVMVEFVKPGKPTDTDPVRAAA